MPGHRSPAPASTGQPAPTTAPTGPRHTPASPYGIVKTPPVPGTGPKPPAPGTGGPAYDPFGPHVFRDLTASYLTSGAETITLTAGATAQIVDALGGDDRVTLTGSGAIRVLAGEGNDTVVADGTATAGRYEIEGGAGDDVIDLTRLTIDAKVNGGIGADRILGGAGNDSLDGGAKRHETLDGTLVDSGDYIDGGAGDDRIKGGDGDDTLIGGSGFDYVSGGDGADRITGGTGADKLTGGYGADRFVFAAGDAAILTDPNGNLAIDSVGDFEGGVDALSLGFTVRAVLGTGTTVFTSFEEARAAASSLMAATAGSGEIVAVASGRDTILFFSSTGGDVADSAIKLDGTSPEAVSLGFFI